MHRILHVEKHWLQPFTRLHRTELHQMCGLLLHSSTLLNGNLFLLRTLLPVLKAIRFWHSNFFLGHYADCALKNGLIMSPVWFAWHLTFVLYIDMTSNWMKYLVINLNMLLKQWDLICVLFCNFLTSTENFHFSRLFIIMSLHTSTLGASKDSIIETLWPNWYWKGA